MRAVVLTNQFPPHHYGGYELLCARTVDRWRAAGHDVLVLTSDWRIEGVEEQPESRDRVRRELAFWWHDHEILHPHPARRVVMERRSHRALTAAIEDFRPDVVSAWAMGGLSLGLLVATQRRGLPVVHVVCDDWLLYGPVIDAWSRPFRTRPRLGRLVERVAGLPTDLADLGAGSRFCFISDFTRQRALDGGRFRLDHTSIVPAGIDTEAFPVASGPVETRTWNGALLYAGRIDARKGIDVAVRALAELPDCTLTVDGRGDDRHLAELHDLAGDLRVTDRLEFVTSEQGVLRQRYLDADAVLFPSTWPEPFGLVPLEAMACDTPVVASGVGGSGEYLVDGVNSVLAPTGDAAALAGAVRRLASDPGLRRVLIVAGRTTAATYTVERCAHELLAEHLAVVADAAAVDR